PPFVSDRIQINSKDTLKRHFKMNARRQALIRNLELLIIDEVSMLRADLLDAMDFMLRKVRRLEKPFGGVQILYIGDLLQLPPIVQREEQTVLREYYAGNFFFHAKAVEEQPPLYIELDKIFRQNDQDFIGVLNNLRNNHVTSEDLKILNQYVRKDFDATKHDGYITLTTHNAKAESINTKALEALTTKKWVYDAKVQHDFPQHIHPLPEKLELKIGAQVMFIKNDPSPEKLYFNGKIGRIIDLSNDEIKVHFTRENRIISVEKYEWENVRYNLNEQTGEIEEEVIGSFVHYPLKLAWAITVHKSQGLTFEKAVLDISSVFVPGQAYVALSRLTSLKGLVLLNPIYLNGLTSDQDVVNYAQNKAKETTLKTQLESGTIQYIQNRIEATFNWERMVSRWLMLENEHRKASEKSEMGKNREDFEKSVKALMATLEPARKFRNQMTRLCQPHTFAINKIFERVESAFAYFLNHLEPVLDANLKQILLLSSKTGTKQYIEELREIDELLTETILDLHRTRQLVENMYNGRELSKDTIWNEKIKNYKVVRVQIIKNQLSREQPGIQIPDKVKHRKSEGKKKTSSKKPPTYLETLRLIEEGKNVEEIAEIRSLQSSTIYGHIAKLIKEEKVDINQVLESDRLEELKDVLGNEFSGNLSDMKEKIGRDFTWEELRLYQASRLL
ncbi:MAG: helix-turn-helix domain-containing protein, partial [Brumimicrobium sp.]|nr:helix-turn-helix domain-containing protein [Brumimicrobium sp.]